MERFVFRNCTTVVALNLVTKQNLERRSFRAVYIPNAVDIERYPDHSGNGDYVLATSRFVKTKGLHHLLEAYSGVDEGLRRRFRLIVMGYGPEKAHLQSMTAELGVQNDVAFLDRQPYREFIETMSGCAVFVLPSSLEAFPVTLIEAMACGKAVIASDIPGPRDIIEHEQNGILFEAGDVNALTKSLEAVLADRELMVRLGTNARKTVQEHFTFDRIAAEYERVLRSKADLFRNHDS